MSEKKSVQAKSRQRSRTFNSALVIHPSITIILKDIQKKIALARRMPVQESMSPQVGQTVSESDPRLDLESERTPVAAAKTLHFTDNLMDEVMDLSHMSNLSVTTYDLDPPSSEGEDHMSNADQTTIFKVEHEGTNDKKDDTGMFDSAIASAAEDRSHPRQSHSSPPAAFKKPSNSDNKIQINEDTERIAVS